MNNPVIELRGVSKTYRDGVEAVKVLHDVNLSVMPGEIVAIVGASGSGKSTLLHLIGGLDRVDDGAIVVAGRDLIHLSEGERDRLRNQSMGFVYQFHHLLPEFSALDNVAMPLYIHRLDEREAKASAKAQLEAVGLSHRLEHLPSQLSGGERQRVAIARALVARPQCVLADEPTGNLDGKTAQSVFSLFVNLARETKAAVIIVTHDEALARMCDCALRLEDGHLVHLVYK